MRKQKHVNVHKSMNKMEDSSSGFCKIIAWKKSQFWLLFSVQLNWPNSTYSDWGFLCIFSLFFPVFFSLSLFSLYSFSFFRHIICSFTSIFIVLFLVHSFLLYCYYHFRYIQLRSIIVLFCYSFYSEQNKCFSHFTHSTIDKPCSYCWKKKKKCIRQIVFDKK